MKKLIFIPVLMLLTGCNKPAPAALDLKTEQAIDSMQGIGYVEPVGEVRRLSFLHPGVVGAVLVDVGKEATKGDVIMRQTDREEKAAVAEAEALVASARADYDQTLAGVNVQRIHSLEALVAANQASEAFAKQEADRFDKLYKSGAESFEERDRAEMTYTTANNTLAQNKAELENLRTFVRDEDKAAAMAKVVAAEAHLDSAKARLAETELHAPFDGQVLEVLRREGETTYDLTNEPVMIFANPKLLRVRAEIEESYALHLKAGEDADVIGRDIDHKTYKGKVVLVKKIMGKKTVFASTSTERKDVDVLQVLIDLPPGTELPIGLEVDVSVKPDSTVSTAIAP